MTMRCVSLMSSLLVLSACTSGIVADPVDSGGGGGAGGSGGGDDAGEREGGAGAGNAGGSILPDWPDGGPPSRDGSLRFGDVALDPSKCSELRAVVRDFRGWADATGPRHSDFQHDIKGPEKGLVLGTLGAELKPELASPTGTKNIASPASFREWFTDVDGVNKRLERTIRLQPDPSRPGMFVYSNSNFFPIDNDGWGNQKQDHNYCFTTEIHLKFTYNGGEVFTFLGDDDLFLFINNRLAIDLGGIHSEQAGTVDLDKKAAQLGITRGNVYQMDIFHAERHADESHFNMETTIACFESIIVL